MQKPEQVQLHSRAGSASHPLVIQGASQPDAGYGQITRDVVSGLARMGVRVEFVPLPGDCHPYRETIMNYTPEIRPGRRNMLLMHPPNCLDQMLRDNVKTVVWTMYETTRLMPEWVKQLNRSNVAGVIVPSMWGASCFSAAGVDTQIKVCPLWIDDCLYRYHPVPDLNGTLVFGTAGKSAHGWGRKRMDEVVEAFRRAFPTEKDVVLKVKCFEDCPLGDVGDPRIHVVRGSLNDDQMADWYRYIHVFVSASRAEGWGLHQHQAMMTGRPVMGTLFGGVTEFVDSLTSYPVEWEMEDGSGSHYEGQGHWAKPNISSMVDAMRGIYRNRNLIEDKGFLSHKIARRLNKRHGLNKLMSALKGFGVI